MEGPSLPAVEWKGSHCFFSLLKSKEFAFLQYTLQLRIAAPKMASLSVFPGFGWNSVYTLYLHWDGSSCLSPSGLVSMRQLPVYVYYGKDACSVRLPMAEHVYVEKWFRFYTYLTLSWCCSLLTSQISDCWTISYMVNAIRRTVHQPQSSTTTRVFLILTTLPKEHLQRRILFDAKPWVLAMAGPHLTL